MFTRYDLRRLREPTQEALREYQRLTGDRIQFDPRTAGSLAIVAGKPNYARSVSVATFSDRSEAELVTVVFMPEDGTGNDSMLKLRDTRTPNLPRNNGVLPRSKAAMRAEVSMAVCAAAPDLLYKSPTLFAGKLSLLGVAPKPPEYGDDTPEIVVPIGHLGQDDWLLIYSDADAKPVTTLTVGPVKDGKLDLNGERQGDPHAIYNPFVEQLAVVSFLGITQGASDEAFAALQELNPQVTFQ